MNLKISDSLVLDSAVWYLEGVLNLEYANNNHLLENQEFYHATITVLPVEGTLTMEQILNAYIYFSEKLEEINANQSNPAFTYDMIDIHFHEANLKDGAVDLEMTAASGWYSTSNYVLFGGEDYWYWGNGQGKCGNYSGYVGTDASDLLQYKFNHPRSVLEPGTFIPTSIEWKDVTGYMYDDQNNPGPYCDAMIFYYETSITPPPGTPEPCLDPDELNYYLSTFDYIKYDQRPVGKTFKNVEIYDDLIPNGTYNMHHLYTLYYGVFVPSGGQH
ncbi:MAG: hypothetical protein ISS19_04070 [Bacteroidales bacterium]|nr:hypothetical protein [Bacteroidales bacterium]